MRDEGIGIAVVERLRGHQDMPAGADVLDLGTGGLTVLHAIEGREKAIFVDCAMMGASPGTIRRFAPDEVRTRKVCMRLSLHEGDLISVLGIARDAGDCPDDIVIFGVQPGAVEQGEGLSPELARRMDEYVGTVISELRSTTGRATRSCPARGPS